PTRFFSFPRPPSLYPLSLSLHDALPILKALKSVTISAPADAGELRILTIANDGAHVKQGDAVVEFDKTKTEQDLAQYHSSLRFTDRKSTRLNSSHRTISYAVFCLKKKKK